MIVQALNEIQSRCGWLPPNELRRLSQQRGVPLRRLHEVASFFPHYRLEPRSHKLDVQVCRDMSCFLRGAASLHERIQSFAEQVGSSVISVEGVSCLGQCDAAPAVAIEDHACPGLAAEQIEDHLRSLLAGRPDPLPEPDRSPVGWSIDIYRGNPQYTALREFIESRDVDKVLSTLGQAGLAGLGGAGFPTQVKWATVRTTPSETKYVVCNADESEPGTFKDRELLRRAPWLVIEGMIIAGLVVGARQGYIYIRHEYHHEIEALEGALRQAYEEHLLGPSILDSGQAFDLELFVSPGGYICGEESALLEAMEDRRAEPRNKPPFPVHVGLRGRPTVINNVETLSWVPSILIRGGEWYAKQGLNGASGLRLVSISGDVARPGVYETPFGLTVGELIFERAGGMRDGQQLKAIAPSGPSGGFLPARIPADQLSPAIAETYLADGADSFDIRDLPLEGKLVRSQGALLGAAFVVVGNRTSIVEMAANCVRFYRNESCGKCVPCRLGTEKLVNLLDTLLARRFPTDGRQLIEELALTMELSSICGLGMIAAKPITSVLRYFSSELESYLVPEFSQATEGSAR